MGCLTGAIGERGPRIEADIGERGPIIGARIGARTGETRGLRHHEPLPALRVIGRGPMTGACIGGRGPIIGARIGARTGEMGGVRHGLLPALGRAIDPRSALITFLVLLPLYSRKPSANAASSSRLSFAQVTKGGSGPFGTQGVSFGLAFVILFG